MKKIKPLGFFSDLVFYHFQLGDPSIKKGFNITLATLEYSSCKGTNVGKDEPKKSFKTKLSLKKSFETTNASC